MQIAINECELEGSMDYIEIIIHGTPIGTVIYMHKNCILYVNGDVDGKPDGIVIEL